MLTLKCTGVSVLQTRFEISQLRKHLKLTATQGSGTAVLLEVIRIFGELRKTGWRPLRTIEFASWYVSCILRIRREELGLDHC